MPDLLDLRRQFPRLSERVYLNAASEGPMPERAVQEAVRRAYEFATKHGVLSVAAAGNSSLNVEDFTPPNGPSRRRSASRS